MNKIYETQSYTKSIITTVVSCEKVSDNSFYATLEDSIFFPEEGGQYADTGVIVYSDKQILLTNGEFIKSASAVYTDEETGRTVQKDSETSIRYSISDYIEPGSQVECILDWDIRYSRMQNHSGEHILSGLIHNK